MVTAEIAVALPAVVLVLLLVLSAVSAGVAQLRVTDAARVAARQAAIGSDDVEGAAVRAGGEVSVEAWSRSPTGGGDPGAASVMTPILGGEPGWTLLRRKEPRGGVGLFKVVCNTNQGALSWSWFETQTPVDEEVHHECCY